MYTYEYPMVSVACDLIVIHVGSDPSKDKILLIKRGGEPYKDCMALPGGFVEINELPIDAAKRELKEETNLDIDKEEIYFIKMADKVDRDPRGRTYSYIYDIMIDDDQAKLAVAGDDASGLNWVNVQDIINKKIPLAFDHEEILNEYFESYGLSVTN